MTVINAPVVIPNLPIGQVVDKEGNFTAPYLNFFQQLITTLQTIAGGEGLVSPSQPAANITTIQNNLLPSGQHSCAYGTFLYDSDNNVMKVALNNGSGAPTFKTVQTA